MKYPFSVLLVRRNPYMGYNNSVAKAPSTSPLSCCMRARCVPPALPPCTASLLARTGLGAMSGRGRCWVGAVCPEAGKQCAPLCS